MLPLSRFLRAALLLACGLPCAARAQTANVTTLHSLAGPTNGATPLGTLALGSDGNFYGTTANGGPAEQGTIFVVTPTGKLTTLYSFSASTSPYGTGTVNADGAGPAAGLVQGRDGRFYGTATYGGDNGAGTVFAVTAGGTLTTLHSFSFDEGIAPAGLCQGSDGRFYGVTVEGGNYGSGTVFAITPAGGLTVLSHFGQDDQDENSPNRGTLVEGPDGRFYGTAFMGGPGLGGEVYAVTPTGERTVLHAFAGGDADGMNPAAGLLLGRDGNFYGTTTGGGSGRQGTVFRLTPAGALTILHFFTGQEDGASPNSPLFQAADGTLYGATVSAAFKIAPDGQFTTLATFGGDNGGPGPGGAGLVTGPDGNFYGVLSDTTAAPGGAVYRMTPAGALSTFYVFDRRGSEGSLPLGKLTQGSDGNLYGTASEGGEGQQGTVFTITPAGTWRMLHHFRSGDAGYEPSAGLIQARDGRFYGTTASGSGNGGTIFSVGADGGLTTLSQFPADGSLGMSPLAALTQGGDGSFYGTTSAGGGVKNAGTVFALSPTGTLTNLHVFTGDYQGSNGDGAAPEASLTAGSDGRWYGTTISGGSAGKGTVYAVTPAGSFSTLYNFTGYADGSNPRAELAPGSDGNFYGTTPGDGFSAGTVFTVTPTGTLRGIYAFSSARGDYYSSAGLTQAADGNFYGTTPSGGTYDHGTAFVITPAGTLTTLYQFIGTDGIGPVGTLLRASDGNLYGTTRLGGLYNLGAVYRLTPGGTAPAATAAPDAQVNSVHPDTVTQSDNGDAFILSVANVGTAATAGSVTVTVTPGMGLTLADVSGPGWTCVRNGGGWTCTRTDALGVGHYYPALTALVNVSPDAPATGTLTSRVAATGDTHAANDTLADSFPINAAASTPTQRWRYRYFGTTANSGSAADSANPAGDGLSNLMKYALGLDPTQAEAMPVVVDTTTGYLRLTAPKNPDATDVSYAVQVSAGPLFDGQGWTVDGTVPVQNTATLLQVCDATLVGGADQRFIRLEVSR